MRAVAEKNLQKLLNLKVKKVAEFLPQKIELESLKLSEVEFVVQRLEPMKAPFPPIGKANVGEVLSQLKELFPKHIFNCPINLGDKEVPQEINRILAEKIATPTAEFELTKTGLFAAIKLMSQEYQKLYGGNDVKLVFKPKNSAQSLGVFAVEFASGGLDLAAIKSQKISQLRFEQNHKIKNNLDEKELQKIIEILCYAQNAKTDQALQELSETEIFTTAKALYNDKILVQPFLKGIESGDIRVNILKNSRGDFYVAGQTFRKSLRLEDKNFTTAYSTGGATAQPVVILQEAEIENLFFKTAQVLKILNGELREKYRDVLELGADFILVGDGKNIFLGEINHHCQALIPLSEAMEKAVNKNAFYEGGMGLTSVAVRDWILRQRSFEVG
jgi:tetratricopeptide (TPR) repeat protein